MVVDDGKLINADIPENASIKMKRAGIKNPFTYVDRCADLKGVIPGVSRYDRGDMYAAVG